MELVYPLEVLYALPRASDEFQGNPFYSTNNLFPPAVVCVNEIFIIPCL
jgi:hypothetical protein